MDGTDGGRQRAALLLRTAKDGDVSAAAELVKTLGPCVIKFLKNKFKAEILVDAFHDTLLKFIRKPELYDPAKGCFLPFLTTAVSNAASDMCRKEQRRPKVKNGICGELEDAAAPVVPFYDSLAIREEREELMEKLGILRMSANALECDLIDLAVNDGMQGPWAKDLAEKHGISPNNVSVCWGRLRKKIQSI